MEENKKSGVAVQEAPVQEAPAARETAKTAAKKDMIPMAPQRRTFFYTVLIWLYWLVAKVIYFIRFEGMENLPKDRCVIMMGNHQHIFDPLALALCARDREIHFMGKKELWNNKLLGWLFTRVHGFPVDRGNMDMAAIRTAMQVLDDGETLGIFPEGTRSKTGHMLPILSGAPMMALRSKRDVVPVYIDGNYKLFRKITVRVGKPIEMEDLRAMRVNKDSIEELTRRIEASFAELSGGKSLPAGE